MFCQRINTVFSFKQDKTTHTENSCTNIFETETSLSDATKLNLDWKARLTNRRKEETESGTIPGEKSELKEKF